MNCTYVKRPLEMLTKSSLRQVAHRLSIEMDIYKQLEVYWRNLTQSSWAGSLSGTQTGETSVADFRLAHKELVNLEDQASVTALATLFVFSQHCTMTLPHYTVNFDAKSARHYWDILCKPIHFDLNKDFEDEDFRRERRAAGLMERQPPHIPFPSYRTQDAAVPEAITNAEVSAQSRSPSSPSSSASAEYHVAELILPPYNQQSKSYIREVHGTLVSSTGRLFDAVDDFLRIKWTSPTDLVSLLEYGVAFLVGLFVIGQHDVMRHIGINCRRVLNDLIFRRKDELTGDLPIRIINCATIMSFYYADIQDWSILNTLLLFAHAIAVDHNLHTTEPLLTARIYLILLWYARTQGEREYYMRLCGQYFPSAQGIDFRCKFSYVSGAVRSQGAQESCIETGETGFEYWSRVSSYLDDCDQTFAMLDKFGLGNHSLLYFKSLSCIMRAELEARIGNNEAPVEQGLAIVKYLGGLSDVQTLVSLCHLNGTLSDIGKYSATFVQGDRSTTVVEYMRALLATIAAPPLEISSMTQAISHAALPLINSPTFPPTSASVDPGEVFYATQSQQHTSAFATDSPVLPKLDLPT